MVMKRRKLLSFADTKSEAMSRRKFFQKKGATRIVIRPQFGGFSVLGNERKKRR